MRVTVTPRVVAAPWDATRVRAGRATAVGLEANVCPEPGPLAEYQSVFPHRYVAWSREHQLFEIRHVDPEEGTDERIELVFRLAAPPDPETQLPRTEEELAELAKQRDPSIVRVFRDFDYAFARQRLREAYTFTSLGLVRYNAERTRQRQRLEQSRTRGVAGEMAAAFNDIKRWMPTLAEYHRTGNAADALVEKPVIGTGFTPA